MAQQEADRMAIEQAQFERAKWQNSYREVVAERDVARQEAAAATLSPDIQAIVGQAVRFIDAERETLRDARDAAQAEAVRVSKVGGEQAAAIMDLRLSLIEARRVLTACQWSRSGACPSCEGTCVEGHDRGCEIAAVLIQEGPHGA